jgi:hypothetical protein
MENNKYYKKYLKYKHKYTLLKNAFSNEMYAQYGGTNVFAQPKPVLRASPGARAPAAAGPAASPLVYESPAPPPTGKTNDNGGYEILVGVNSPPPGGPIYQNTVPPPLPRSLPPPSRKIV